MTTDLPADRRPGPRPDRVPHGHTAHRPSWEQLPDAVREAIEARAGVVVAGASQGGGFTDGFASRLRLADDSRLFVKAISSSTNEEVFAAYEQELLVAGLLPAAVPAPLFRWSCRVGDWLVLAFEDIEGQTPARPWRPAELERVLDAATVLARALTPAPAQLGRLSTTLDLDAEFTFWRRWSEGGTPDGAAALPTPWAAALPLLAELEGEWSQAAAGDSAVHFDLRDDNVLLATDGRVLVCDWNWLCRAAPWVDLVGLLVSVHGDGLDADGILVTHELTRDVPPRSIDAYLVALAGYFVEAAARPPFAHSPWLRAHQAWWRDATLDWLSVRLDSSSDRERRNGGGMQTVVLSGTVGVGKTAVAAALVDELRARGYRSTSIDVDDLTFPEPRPSDDPFAERAVVAHLTSLRGALRDDRTEILVLPRVVETHDQRDDYADAVAGPLRVVRLDASAATRHRRLLERHGVGPDRDWHLARTDVLADILLTCGVEDLAVTNDGRTVESVAAEIADRLGLD